MIDSRGSDVSRAQRPRRFRVAPVLLAGVLALTIPAGAGIVGSAVIDERRPPHTVSVTRLAEPVPDPADPVGRPSRTLTSLLTAQRDALLRGDQAGWLAALDPSNSAMIRDLTRMFANLRTMGVTSWQPKIDSVKREPGAPAGTAKAVFGFCFRTPTCPTAEEQQGTRRAVIKADLSWALKDGAVVLTAFTPAGTFVNGIDQYPWQTDTLTASGGSRVVVAAPPSLSSLIPRALAAANRAAPHVDTFTVGDRAPATYTIYLAGTAEWRRWFQGESDDYIGYAIPTSRMTWDIVLRIKGIDNGDLEATIRHEMAHVVTLGTWHSTSYWWMVEGLAEYVAYGDVPVSKYLGLSYAKQYVRRGLWNGSLAVEPLTGEDNYLAYAMAYLSARSLVDRYGKERFLDFFEQVVLRDTALDIASRRAFGAPWDEVDAACSADMRRFIHETDVRHAHT